MRSITLNSVAEYQALDALVRGSASQRSDALASLSRLNAHVDFAAIGPGTVVLLPDVPAFREVVATSAGSYAFEELRSDILASFDGSVSRSTASGELLLAEHKELRAAFTAAAERFTNGDPGLKTAIAAGVQTVVEEQKSMKESVAILKRLRQDVEAELDFLDELME